jgi:hypothetical protein
MLPIEAKEITIHKIANTVSPTLSYLLFRH